MTLELALYLILAIMAVVSALMVVTRKSPITATMFLVMHFMTLGGLYLTLVPSDNQPVQVPPVNAGNLFSGPLTPES